MLNGNIKKDRKDEFFMIEPQVTDIGVQKFENALQVYTKAERRMYVYKL